MHVQGIQGTSLDQTIFKLTELDRCDVGKDQPLASPDPFTVPIVNRVRMIVHEVVDVDPTADPSDVFLERSEVLAWFPNPDHSSKLIRQVVHHGLAIRKVEGFDHLRGSGVSRYARLDHGTGTTPDLEGPVLVDHHFDDGPVLFGLEHETCDTPDDLKINELVVEVS